MFDGPLMLWVNWPLVDPIHPRSDKFVMGATIKGTGELKLNDSLLNSPTFQTISPSLDGSKNQDFIVQN